MTRAELVGGGAGRILRAVNASAVGNDPPLLSHILPTDFYVWKLLPCDLTLDRRQAELAFHEVIGGVAGRRTDDRR